MSVCIGLTSEFMEMEDNQVLQIGAQVLLDPPFENGLFKPPSKHVEGQREHQL